MKGITDPTRLLSTKIVPVPTSTNFINLTNQRFGLLTVLGYTGRPKRQTTWLCLCDCGKQVTNVLSSNLRRGCTQSCGCYNFDRITVHGGSYTSTYQVWKAMKRRCLSPKSASFKDYGGRGITICERWRQFKNFLADMGERPSPKYSIDRIDVNGNYEPDNCRWATRQEQARNTRKNRIVEYQSRKMPLVEACELAGEDHLLVRGRLHLGWPLEAALTTPKGVVFNHRPRETRTICAQGHVFTEEEVAYYEKRRRCKKCCSEAIIRSKQKRKHQ